MELSKNYVTCDLVGRLGNLMFQIAHAHAQGWRHGRQVIIPKEGFMVGDYFTNVFRDVKFFDRFPTRETSEHIHGSFTFSPRDPSNDKPTVFFGYYQSEKYFYNQSDNIRNMFGPPESFIQSAYEKYPQLKNGTVAAINVRRGDYLHFPRRHPVVTVEYIQRAVQALPKTDHIFVVSDDIPWCRENIKIPNLIFCDYVTWEALWFLSLCHHYVISNSTFSWWGAWLSKNKDKVVVSPSTWFGPDVAEDPRDIWCDNWIKIDTSWDNGYIVCK